MRQKLLRSKWYKINGFKLPEAWQLTKLVDNAAGIDTGVLMRFALVALVVFLAATFNSFTLLVLAGVVAVFPSLRARHGAGAFVGAQPKKLQFNTKGLTGDNLKMFELLNEKIEDLPEIISKENVVAEIKSMFKDFFNDKGENTLNMKKLQELLGDDDKGIINILKKQGEAIAALKEKAGKPEKMNVKQLLDDSMEELQKIVRAKSGFVKLNVKTAANMTLSNTITGDNLLPDDLIESFSIGAFVPKRYPTEYIWNIVSRTTLAEITEFKTWLEEGSEQGAFAVVSEGATKPLVSYSLVRNYASYKKVAAKYVVTEEFAKFRQEAYSIIQRLINLKIQRDYAALLTTDLIAAAAPYVSSALDGQYAAPTDFHAIAAVAAQIESLNFQPNLLIMNPQDKWRIGMEQDTQGRFYLTIPFQGPNGQTTFLGFQVITSNRVAVGNFILGEAGLFEVEDEPLTIRLGYGIDVTTSGGNVTAVTSDFDNNRFRVIVETFFRDFIATNNQGSFVYASFATVKAAVTA